MFGHDDNNIKDDNSQPVSTQPINPGLLGIEDDGNIEPSVPPTPIEPTTAPIPGAQIPSTPSLPVTPAPTTQTQTNNTNPIVSSSSSSILDPINDNTPTSTQAQDNIVTPTSVNTLKTSSLPSNDELVSIKRQALQELTPLIDHLEQNSEEKFKTTMMMIQASDDQNLIPQAFRVAKEIPDEKNRAQALLDIVNEINYFTHKSDD